MKQIKFNNQIFTVLDETQTHFVCEPQTVSEGYHFISRDKAVEI